MLEWLEHNHGRFDCLVCFTYLYWPTWSVIQRFAGRVAIVLHPTVHDEPPLRLSIFDEIFHAPDAFALSAPEEGDLIRRRFGVEPIGDVVGIGVDVRDATPERFRERYPVGDEAYLLYAGRIDEGKGAGQLLEFFVEYKNRHRSDSLKLVMLGDALIRIPLRDDIVATGFVDYDVRDSAIAGALALVQPSFFESFSMILTEAFALGRPALVQGRCAVLRGHADRSGAAIPYAGFAEFECALEMLRADEGLVDAMGAAGRAYVERNYTWDVVLDRYERLLERTVALHRRRSA